MANIRTCNKHNMLACVVKTEHIADFIKSWLSQGCSIIYSLLDDSGLIVENIRVIYYSMIPDGIRTVFLEGLRYLGLAHRNKAMRNSPKFSGRITPLTPPMLEVITALAAEEAHTHRCADISNNIPMIILPQMSLTKIWGDEGYLSDLYALKQEVKEAQEAKHFSSQTDSQAKGQTQETVKREQVIIEEEKDTSDVKSGDTEELDLERIQSTARQSAVTPRTLNFVVEAGPSSLIRPIRRRA
ncbi:hypothetical protein Tco_1021182 [Tanacetum coccineum]